MTDDDERQEEWATRCDECQATFGPDEDGHGWEECIECGSTDVVEVNW